MKIDSPDCRIIEYHDEEFFEMIINLERVSVGNNSLNNKVQYDIKERPFVLIYEYVPSLVLYEFGVPRAEKIFKKENFKSREIFISLGRILGLDILFNNYDRVPFLWNNPGNPNNLLFRVNLELLPPGSKFKDIQFLDIFIENSVAIDSKPICLDPSDKYSLKSLSEYLNTLSENLKEFFYEMKNLMIFGKNLECFEFRCFAKLVEFFKNSCGILISSTNIFHISLGMITMFQDVLNLDIQSIENLILFVQNKAIIMDWADVFKSNAKLLNLSYFKYIINYLKNLKEENEEIFNWVRDVTVDFYNVNFDEEVKKVISFQESLVMNNKHDDLVQLSNQGQPVSQSLDKNKIQQINPEENIDEFNINKNDKKKFTNDVHNGIYDIHDIDPSWVMETKKREYNNYNYLKKEAEIPDIKPVVKEVKKLDLNKIEENLDPHKKYTLEELKEKIQKDELKQTLNIKKNLNPEEFKFIEDKIKKVDEYFFEDK
jgi:hypothetical protein